MVSAEALVKRAKVDELARDFTRFTSGPLTKIMREVHNKTARIFLSKHFTERMVDRDFFRREDRLFMFKLLSWVVEKKADMLMQDQDIFVKYKNYTIMIFSEFRNGIQQIRLNTFFNTNCFAKGETFLNEKNGRKVVSMDVGVDDLMNYTPYGLRKA
jgi:hypothetical protein